MIPKSKDLSLPNLVFIVGPTACGKSDFAVEVAEACRSWFPNDNEPELINCDSVQFFAGVDIGAAKPEPELLARARHHLIGHVGLGQDYNAGDFRRDSLALIEKRRSEGVNRFLPVGGSGFYVQALEKGMFDVPEIPEEIRLSVLKDEETLGVEVLYRELVTRDPDAASRIKPADRYRISRALEILRTRPDEGTLGDIKARFEVAREPQPFRVSKIGLFRNRQVLRDRVTSRVRKMMERGFIEEVEELRRQGLGAWTPLRSVGYKEIQELLDGKISRSELEPLIVTSTMQLAKRQMTWFKRDLSIRWFDVELGWPEPLVHARRLLET